MREGRGAMCGALLLCGVVMVVGCERSGGAEAQGGAALRPAGAAAREVEQPGPQWEGFSAREVRMIRQMAAPGEPPRDATNEVSGDERAGRLGQRLFFDVRLSGNEGVSCASCHMPTRQFGSSSRRERGIGVTQRHPPALLNVAYQRWFNWDGSADTLWSQAAGPLEHPDEHGFSRVALVRLVGRDEVLRAEYEAVFGEGLPEEGWLESLPEHAHPGEEEGARAAWEAMSEADRHQINRIFTNLLKALAAYQERLISFDTPFDHWLARQESRVYEGRAQVMGEEAVRGLRHFVGKGRCVTCHNGPLLSDMDFHNLGLGRREWEAAGVDHGRAEGVKRVKRSELGAHGVWSGSRDGDRARWTKHLASTPEDRGQFKTPGLRGVSQTAPYMHVGQFETLEEVVRFYVGLKEEVQVGHREESLVQVHLSPQEQRELVAFLRALSVEGVEASWSQPLER